MTVRRPSRWAFSPAFIDPRYSSLWRGVQSVFPLWEGGGVTVYNAATGRTGTHANFPTWAPFGLDFDSASNERVEIDVADAVGDSESHAVVIVFRSTTSTQGVLYQEGHTSQQNQVLSVSVHGDEATPFITYVLRGDSSSAFRRSYYTGTNVDYADGEWHCVVMSIQNQQLGGATPNFFGYVDGVDMFVDWVTFPTSSTPPGARTFTKAIIGRGVYWDDNPYDGDIAFFASWRRAITRPEARLLSADPFGMLRPVVRVTDRYLPTLSMQSSVFGVPYSVTVGSGTGWTDELANTTDAELINSVNVRPTTSTYIDGP